MLDIEERALGGAPEFVLQGELNFETAPALREPLLKHVASRQMNVVINMSELRFMDTCGLATLIEMRMKASQYGGRVILLGLGPLVAQVFEIARVKQFFVIVQDEQEALSAMSAPADAQAD